MTVSVEMAFKAVQHVVGRGDADLGRDLGGSDGAVARATQEDHRPLLVAGCGPYVVPQFGREVLVARACRSNTESRWVRRVTQALCRGYAVTSAKYTSSPLIINSTPKTPRPPSALTMRAATDLEASNAALLISWGCQDSSRPALARR